MHSYFKWSDPTYQRFMIEFMRRLEPRRVFEGEIFINELEEVLEMIFVMKGSYRVGYEINKTMRMRLMFPSQT